MKKLWVITLALTIGVIAITLGLYFFHAGFLDSIETRTYDFRFKVMRGKVAHNPNIAIIAIDDKSIGELGRFPWSREHYVPLLDNLSKAGAKAVLMDAFFPEVQEERIDRAFADAIARAGNVTLASAFEFSPEWEIENVTISLPVLTEATKNTAHINFLPDEDGVNRWNLLVIPYDGMPIPSLGLMGAIEAMDATLEDLVPEEGFITFGKTRIPVDFLGRMLINYTGGPESYEYFSFADIAKGRVAPDKMKGKVFFLGATALGVYDMRETPFSPNTPGVETHAAVADTIIRGEFLRKGTREAMLDAGMVIFLALAVYGISLRFRPVVALPAVAVLFGAYIYFAYAMFLAGHWVSMVYPLFGLTMSYAMTAYARFYLIDKKAREMRSIFSSYVSHKVVDQLVKHPEAAKIGGDNKEITILFSDVKGYTSYSEKRTPEEVVKTLNEYLGAMSTLIIDHDGTLDKFLGDGIMAYWGAPLHQENHDELAVRCTLAMLDKLKELQDKWASEGTEPFSIRVGLNSGRVVAGNIGAAGKKMEYTVIGDSVNLASRLEGTGKLYGVTVLVSESTYEPTKDKFIYRELDCIRVVGKSKPIKIFELVGEPGKADPKKVELNNRFAEALGLYCKRNFVEARKIFSGLAAEYNDHASEIYVERCDGFIEVPPPADWDGVYTRTSK